MKSRGSLGKAVAFVVLLVLAVVYLFPILLVLMNSFKGRFFISDTPFAFPTAKTFAGIQNYIAGIAKPDFSRPSGIPFSSPCSRWARSCCSPR
jgi:raffinose/stachyose/melibiose transport system permease protein